MRKQRTSSVSVTGERENTPDVLTENLKLITKSQEEFAFIHRKPSASFYAPVDKGSLPPDNKVSRITPTGGGVGPSQKNPEKIFLQAHRAEADTSSVINHCLSGFPNLSCFLSFSIHLEYLSPVSSPQRPSAGASAGGGVILRRYSKTLGWRLRAERIRALVSSTARSVVSITGHPFSL